MRFVSVSRWRDVGSAFTLGRCVCQAAASRPVRRRQQHRRRRPPAAAPAVSPVERGKMLVMGGGCHDCHTPRTRSNGPEAEWRTLSGHPESTVSRRSSPMPRRPY